MENAMSITSRQFIAGVIGVVIILLLIGLLVVALSGTKAA